MSLGFEAYPKDPSLYLDRKMIIIVFINDFLTIFYLSESRYAYRIRDLLEEQFKMKRSGELT